MAFYREFKNKQEKEEYKKIGLTIWGGLPLDVDWAVGANIYKNSKQKIDMSGIDIFKVDVPELFEIIK